MVEPQVTAKDRGSVDRLIDQPCSKRAIGAEELPKTTGMLDRPIDRLEDKLWLCTTSG